MRKKQYPCSAQRVAHRVKQGGYNIPTDVIYRRYELVSAREVFTKIYNEPVPTF